MADYIRSNILSQAYIHVKAQPRHTDEHLETIRRHLEEFARSRTDFYLYPETEVKIELEDGSIKARITVLGTVFLLLQGIANYPDFREGVSLAYTDARQLAEYINLEAQYQFGAKHEDVIRLEARTGVLTSLRQLIGDLERLERAAAAGTSAGRLAVELVDIRREIDKLKDNLATDADRELLKEGLLPVVANLPKTPKQPKRGRNSKQDLALYREERNRLLSSLK